MMMRRCYGNHYDCYTRRIESATMPHGIAVVVTIYYIVTWSLLNYNHCYNIVNGLNTNRQLNVNTLPAEAVTNAKRFSIGIRPSSPIRMVTCTYKSHSNRIYRNPLCFNTHYIMAVLYS